MCIWSKFK